MTSFIVFMCKNKNLKNIKIKTDIKSKLSVRDADNDVISLLVYSGCINKGFHFILSTLKKTDIIPILY